MGPSLSACATLVISCRIIKPLFTADYPQLATSPVTTSKRSRKGGLHKSSGETRLQAASNPPLQAPLLHPQGKRDPRAWGIFPGATI